MTNPEKKAIDATADLIYSLNNKIKELNINDIKKLTDKENAAALGLIVCCTSTPAKADNKTKSKNKKK
ncbi:MAG: hypothetical protein ACP5SD_02085 [Elusimicrobiales bacterium]|nr:hypothetical protein [Elusimicrobiales bacterium]HOL62863.1 hypothetical protein [Elusimicrobiales bacterium]HPO95810.1 hypothetical protein [Elusimicrobiales bacterium]